MFNTELSQTRTIDITVEGIENLSEIITIISLYQGNVYPIIMPLSSAFSNETYSL